MAIDATTLEVNIHGIEELVADKGYLSGAVLKWVKRYGVRGYIPEKRQKGKRRRQGTPWNSKRSAKSGDGWKASTARAC